MVWVWGPGVGSAVLTLLLGLAVTPTLSQCQLCHCPNVQDRGEMASGSSNTEEIPCRQWEAGSSKQSLPIPNATLCTGCCSLSSSTHDKPKTSRFQSRRAPTEGVHVHSCYMADSINTRLGNFCVLSSPYAADSHHQRVDGHPQLWRVCAPIHWSRLCWARQPQGKATQVGWENKLYEGRYVLWQAFLLLFSLFLNKANNKKELLKMAVLKLEKREDTLIWKIKHILKSNKTI